MTKERWAISDHHLGHKNILNFENHDGSKVRDFSSVDEMNENIIEKHNSAVKEGDVCYFLGDVAINQRYLELLSRMNGSKRLIRGNHDIFALKKYTPYFKDIYGVRVFVDNFIMSHIPLHPDCITHRFVANVHGHLHSNEIMKEFDGEFKPDPRYLCVCVEQSHINYTPLNLDDVRDLIKDRFAAVGWEYPEKGEDQNGAKLD